MSDHRNLRLKKSTGGADEINVMADVEFAPPLQRLTAPPTTAPIPPPPPPAAPAPLLRLSTPSVAQVRQSTTTPSTTSVQELLRPAKAEVRPIKRKKKRSKKLPIALVLLGALGGAAYYFRNSQLVQKVLGHEQAVVPLPDIPFVRPNITSAEYTVTLSAVQNGAPNNITTKVRADYLRGVNQSTVDSQTGGVFAIAQEIRTPEFLFHPGVAFGTTWTRQPRMPEFPSPFDSADFIPMINDIVDQELRDAMKPTSSKSETIDGVTITSHIYVLDRAKVPEIAPAIYARIPWIFDVPNATTLTVEVSYDETGLVRHLFFGVDPPQPGTGSDATWVTTYTMDVTSLNSPIGIFVPIDVVDVAAGTP